MLVGWLVPMILVGITVDGTGWELNRRSHIFSIIFLYYVSEVGTNTEF